MFGGSKQGSLQLPDVQGHGVSVVPPTPLPPAPGAGARQVASADSVGVARGVLS